MLVEGPEDDEEDEEEEDEDVEDKAEISGLEESKNKFEVGTYRTKYVMILKLSFKFNLLE